MSPSEDPAARRRRRRGKGSAGPVGAAPDSPDGASGAGGRDSAASTASSGGAGRRRSRQPAERGQRVARDTERGWRDLIGSGPSQVGVSGALRARDVARPGPDEFAEAEAALQIVRRQWQPPPAG